MSNVDPQRGKTQRHPGNPRCGGDQTAATPVVRRALGTHHGQPPCHARPRRRLHRDPRCPRKVPDPQRPTGLRVLRRYRHRRVHGRLGPHRRTTTQATPASGRFPGFAPGRPLRAHPRDGRCRDLRRPRPSHGRTGPPLALGGTARLADRAAAGARRVGLQPRRVGGGPGRRRRPESHRSRAGPGHPVDQPAQRPEADPPRARPQPVPGPDPRRRTTPRTATRKAHR